jgi:hypothetical protein
MPYRIPTDIRYEERLFGPLTIKQSIYALVTGAIVGYTLFFSGFDFVLKIFLTIGVGAIGIGFIWFDLESYITNYLYFLKEKKSASWISPAARKLMDIKSIRADAVFLKTGDVLGVVKVKPINFGVLSRDDQDTVIYGFLQFLNSLNFPIQIVMRSINLDLSDYLNALKRRILQRDDKISLAYYEHFSEYMYEYIKTNKINDRLFYIIIPAKHHWDEREVIRSLETRCRTIIEALARSGIVAHRLDNKQLLALYSSYFTQTFNVDEEFLSPITLYRKMWAETPEPVMLEEGT